MKQALVRIAAVGLCLSTAVPDPVSRVPSQDVAYLSRDTGRGTRDLTYGEQALALVAVGGHRPLVRTHPEPKRAWVAGWDQVQRIRIALWKCFEGFFPLDGQPLFDSITGEDAVRLIEIVVQSTSKSRSLKTMISHFARRFAPEVRIGKRLNSGQIFDTIQSIVKGPSPQEVAQGRQQRFQAIANTTSVNSSDPIIGDDLRSFWVKFLRLVIDENPHAAILDIGAGENLHVPLIGRSLSSQLRLYGIDFIEFPPATQEWAVQANIELVPRADATAMPFESRRFNALTAMHSIEYSVPLEHTLAEMNRILEEGGDVGLVMHHPESDILAASAQHLDEIAFLWKIGYLQKAINFITPPENLFDSYAFNEAAQAMLREFNSRVDSGRSTHVLAETNKRLANALLVGMWDGKKLLEDWIQALIVLEETWRDLFMLAAPFADEGRDAIVGLFEEHGFAVEEMEHVTDKGEFVGWWIRLKKKHDLAPRRSA